MIRKPFLDKIQIFQLIQLQRLSTVKQITLRLIAGQNREKERISKEHFESLYHQSLKNDEEHTNELIKRYQDKIKKEELLNKDKQIYDEIDKILETLELYATQLEDLEAESVSITNSNNNNKNRKIEKIDDDSIIIMDNADKLLQKIEELKKQKEKIKQKLNKTRRKKLKSSN